MTDSVFRAVAAATVLVCLAACTPAPTQPGQPSSSDVNPVTGSRGGAGSH